MTYQCLSCKKQWRVKNITDMDCQSCGSFMTVEKSEDPLPGFADAFGLKYVGRLNDDNIQKK